MSATATNPVLDLRVGDVVEVRSEEEILRTLDSRGMLDSLPFMPEMLQFCGKQFRVMKRAEKVCDSVDWGKAQRRMKNAVHLEELRCNGAAHGGCKAGCLMHWKEAWLKRVDDRSNGSTHVEDARRARAPEAEGTAVCTKETLMRETRRGNNPDGEEVFSCQATEMLRATSPLPWWRLGQYVRDVRSGNASVSRVLRSLLIALFNKFQKANALLAPRLALIHGAKTYPFVDPKSTGEAPSSRLNLQPGDLVEVKSKEEIFETLDERDRTKGLRFDSELLKYCGRRGRVSHLVDRIINEKTGTMLPIKSDAVIIEGFFCTGDYHRVCPRGVYSWWRESWLKRVE
jgi:hypothetical protein